jgi:hypothetical protein
LLYKEIYPRAIGSREINNGPHDDLNFATVSEAMISVAKKIIDSPNLFRFLPALWAGYNAYDLAMKMFDAHKMGSVFYSLLVRNVSGVKYDSYTYKLHTN